jgi:hypothetical protein
MAYVLKLRFCFFSTAAVAAGLALGCDSFSPPVRGAMYGAPGRLREGQVEAGTYFAGAAETGSPIIGVPSFGVGLRDWVAIEAGSNIYLQSSSTHGWALGFLGPRFTWVPHRDAKFHFVGDLELGAGVGVGGDDRSGLAATPECQQMPSSCDLRTSWDRLAWGGYQGLGIGITEGDITFFLRARIEETGAVNMPFTLWPSGILGGEVRPVRWLSLSAGAGVIAFCSGGGHGCWLGVGYQFGFTFFIDAWRPSAR